MEHRFYTTIHIAFGIGGFVLILICCCLCKLCRKPRPVITTMAYTSVLSTTPQQHPLQTIASPIYPQSYSGVQYPPYQHVPVQPCNQPTMGPTMPYPGQPFTSGPPPTYQEATFYPPNVMPYSQTVLTPGQPPYPLQPPIL